MAVHVSHASLPYPIKNARYSFLSAGFDADGDPTDPTTPDTEVSQDGGAYADAAEEVTTITGSNGTVLMTLTGAETNNSGVAVAFKAASGPKAVIATLYPRNLPILSSGTLSAGSAGGGTLGTALAYDITGCFIRTTGGTGGGGTGGANNQARRIVTYNTGTGAFTVTPNWETTPSTDTTYDVLCPEGITPAILKALNPTTPGRTADVDASGGVEVGSYQAGAITSAAFAAGAIDASAIAANAIGSSEIADGAITAAKIATDAIDADALADGAITAATFAAGAIDAAAIANGAIDAATFAAGAIDAAAIATDAIDAAALAADAVTEIQSGLALASVLGTPAGASIAADIAAIEAQTDDIGAAGAGLTAIPWNAAWDAEVQSEVDDALVARNLHTLVIVSGAADSGSTTTMVDAARTEADADYWKGRMVLFTSGNLAGQCAFITDFNAGTDTFTLAPALTQAVATQSYVILPGVSAWDDVLAEHLGAGSTGAALNAAGSAGDPWNTALPGAYGAGSAGNIVGNNLNATVGSRATQTSVDAIDDFVDTEVAAIKAKTDQLVFTNANKVDAAVLSAGDFAQAAADKVWSSATRTLTAFSTALAVAVWDVLESAIATASSIGLKVKTNVDALISSRASQTSVDTIDDFLDTEVAAILAAVDTEVAAIKAKTDSLTFTVAGQVDSNLKSLADSANAATNLSRSARTIALGTVGAGSTTTSIVTSALDPAATQADQFKGRVMIFLRDTATAALQDQGTEITANTSGGVFTVVALTTAPASGDLFVIV